MTNIVCLVTLVLLPMLIFSAFNNNQLTQQLSELLASQQLMGLSATVVSNGSIVYQNGFGLSDYTLNVPITNNTHYRIASISKSITTATLMTLFDQNKFSLNDDISQYLGFTVRNPNFPSQPITIRMILSHMSSILDGPTYDDFLTATNNDPSPPPLSSILQPGGQYYSSLQFSNHQPGTYFTYCNLNFGIAGTIIEQISGIRFDIYAKANVLTKLGIDASFNIQDISNISQVAVLYRGSDNTWIPQHDNYGGVKPPPRNLSNYQIGSNGLVFSPAGGCYIAANQLQHFMKMLSNNGTYQFTKILSKNSVQLMTTPVFIYNGSNSDNDGMLGGLIRAYGLGIIISTNTPNVDIVWPSMPMKGHIGSAYGLISNYFFDPLTRSGFTFAINGCIHPYTESNSSAFLQVEQQLHYYFYQYLYENSSIWKIQDEHNHPNLLEEVY